MNGLTKATCSLGGLGLTPAGFLDKSNVEATGRC